MGWACAAVPRVAAAAESGGVLAGAGRGAKVLGLGAIIALASGAAQAENLDAGKSAPALFAAACASCHSSPRGLAKDRGSYGLASYLQEHYTSGPQTAAARAADETRPRRGRGAGRRGNKGNQKGNGSPPPPRPAPWRPAPMMEPVEP